ncbi:hypothetical protein JCM30471_20120 [Desulfuromonas carbonis]|uniref:hypothetical protein n=1 Tax=Desulfuromonas sp. DDH964 TaxID=1823759 RepID=UPI00078DBA62|nr:hypothetical protein [Desulfuromonas sp. DDH964]AMV73595.1 hypothetical protein DBW_3294 [Desulfuromonas sp. DDH964]
MEKIIGLKECNSLCRKCLRACRQPAAALLLDCPRFLPRPFKIDQPRYDQLDLFGE